MYMQGPSSKCPASYKYEPWMFGLEMNTQTISVHFRGNNDPAGVVEEGVSQGRAPDILEAPVFSDAHQYASGDAHYTTAIDNPLGGQQQNGFSIPTEVRDFPIRREDLDALKSEQSLSNNIIDFYILYLQSQLPLKDKERIYCFNSFFFRKLIDSSTDSDQGRVAYESLRKWTRKVDLFKKDYIVIPVLLRWHWSLIIICHLGQFEILPDGCSGTRCILHMDSKEGLHGDIEDHIQNYIVQAWRDKPQSAEFVVVNEANIFPMAYREVKVPQQDNGYDCGLYLLRFAELFLRSAPLYFSLYSDDGFPYLVQQDQFASSEASAKRLFIYNLLLGSCPVPNEQTSPECLERDGAVQERGKGLENITPEWVTSVNAHDAEVEHPYDQSTGNGLPLGNHDQRQIQEPNQPKLGKRKRDCNWEEKETSVLVSCKEQALIVKGSRFCKEKPEVADWDAISKEIADKIGTSKTGKQCRLRWDTLVKSQKKIKQKCEESNKQFSELTTEERRELNLATIISEDWWYDIIDKHCCARTRKCKSPRRENPRGAGKLKQIAIPGYKTLHEDLKSTILNLILGLRSYLVAYAPIYVQMSGTPINDICRWLAIVQDRSIEHCRCCVQALCERKLLHIRSSRNVCGVVGTWRTLCKVEKLRVYKRFAKKQVQNNPEYDTNLSKRSDITMSSFDSFSWPQRLKVLSLCQCRHLETADLSNMAQLRSLCIMECEQLKVVTGWENLKELGWLRIERCKSCLAYPEFEHLTSLKEFVFSGNSKLPTQPNFSQCVQLRRLEIFSDHKLKEFEDLTTLKYLEVLRFVGCEILSGMCGLSGLHSLTHLDLRSCKSLDTLPDIGHLKALAVLGIGGTGIEEIPGVEELVSLEELRCYGSKLRSLPDLTRLRSLTRLDLECCNSLDTLPDIGHLKALAYLDIGGTGIEEIPGVEELVSLEELACRRSKLRSLPDLTRLRSLTNLDLRWCRRLDTLPDIGHLKALAYLDIGGTGIEEIPGVEELVSLEVLLCYGSKLRSLPDLTRLRSLAHLDLECCRSLDTLPDIGHLKALAYLNIEWTDIEEIPGVEELVSLEVLHCYGSKLRSLPDLTRLRSLTRLDLFNCTSLDTLPDIGHLKALAHLNIGGTGIEEIPGVEELVSLEVLHCGGSKLRSLPDLRHLTRLRRVWLRGTPLIEEGKDPSAFYFGKEEVRLKEGKEVIDGEEDSEGIEYDECKEELFGDNYSD